ncbi:MAG TPA: hypothetical protein DCE42_10900 [Myxococcales bacterium]|nr:hypothetical protein [Deltaproteobacteria bacterium]MBU54562.1 hypothetical protein [Deltaproteobacteria bacterium]HAA55255.1 hypothetical protein [Myxococcales bacterium]|tara:strand:- start:27795 stop:28310 length:516 start_codon:yes stop_codon:yes gene_type:complete
MFQAPTSISSRVHLAIGVTDLEASITFYSLLFQTTPSKRRDNYAKFEVAHAPVNLSLNLVDKVDTSGDPVGHFGVEVQDVETVMREIERFKQEGLLSHTEEQVACCYSLQDKTWVADPDGRAWEIFCVHEDVEQYSPVVGRDDCCTEDEPKDEVAKEECCQPFRGQTGACC